MKSKIITSAYWIAGAIHIGASLLDYPDIENMSKAVLMPLLLFLLFVIANGVITLPRLLLAAGLIFSWGGDILLIFKGQEMYFLAGLGSFLIAQLLYTVVMVKSSYQKPQIQVKPLLPVIIYGLFLLGIVIPNAGNLTVPIIVYGICITLMVSASILRRNLTSDDSYLWAMCGAGLFIISDSLIAIDKFVMNLPVPQLLIMSTYISAQYLIVRGILKHPGG